MMRAALFREEENPNSQRTTQAMAGDTNEPDRKPENLQHAGRD
jgi:hypothetical protein